MSAPAAKKFHRNTRNALNASLAKRSGVPISLPAVSPCLVSEQRPSDVPPKAACAVNLPPVVPDRLASDFHATGGLSSDVGQTTLAERRSDQCCFPLWPNKARPGDPLYGQVCGAPVSGASYCMHHQGVVAGSHAETQKAKRIVRATVRNARKLGVA